MRILGMFLVVLAIPVCLSKPAVNHVKASDFNGVRAVRASDFAPADCPCKCPCGKDRCTCKKGDCKCDRCPGKKAVPTAADVARERTLQWIRAGRPETTRPVAQPVRRFVMRGGNC